MPERISAITLDLDDTLWPVDPVIERAERVLHQWCERHAPRVAEALPPAEFARYRRAIAQELPEMAHDFTALRLEALRRALGRYGEDASLAEDGLEVFLGARNEIVLYPDALEGLRRLSGAYRIVALSNGNADVRRIGIDGFFTAVVNARSTGYAKPDRRIFHAACSRLDLPPGEVLHVGDDPELDVRGGAAAGTQTAWINRDGKVWAGARMETFEFPNLLALCDWLGA
jgi:2-haloalkanoic acid dehalogenase type II